MPKTGLQLFFIFLNAGPECKENSKFSKNRDELLDFAAEN